MLKKSQRFSMKNIKEMNQENGKHFFDKKSMAFFKSYIESPLYEGGYFVTSEQNDPYQRLFTVRKVDFETGSIETVGEFQGHKTKKEAELHIGQLQKEDEITK